MIEVRTFPERATDGRADPVQMHASACNALSRCLRELRADHADYDAAVAQLYKARDAVETLCIMAGFGRLN